MRYKYPVDYNESMNTGQQLGRHVLPQSSQIKLACMQVLFSVKILCWLCLSSMFCCDRQQAACNLVSCGACSWCVLQAGRKAKHLPFETVTSGNAAATLLPVLFALPNATTTTNHSFWHPHPMDFALDTQAKPASTAGENFCAFAQPSLVYKHLGRRALLCMMQCCV